MKILIIDDDRDLVELLTVWLKSLGYEIYRAYTGEQAKKEWDEHKPDLVLIEPENEALYPLSVYRDLLQRDDAFVLVMTYGKKMGETNCLKNGADGYLRKPFFPRDLLAQIQQLQQGISSI